MARDDTPELDSLRARTLRRFDELIREYWREKAGRHTSDLVLAVALVAIIVAFVLGWRP